MGWFSRGGTKFDRLLDQMSKLPKAEADLLLDQTTEERKEIPEKKEEENFIDKINATYKQKYGRTSAISVSMQAAAIKANALKATATADLKRFKEGFSSFIKAYRAKKGIKAAEAIGADTTAVQEQLNIFTRESEKKMELIKSLVDEQIVRDKVELRAYESFLKDLQEQNDIRKQSISKLKEAIRALDPSAPQQFAEDNDDLIDIISFLEKQILK
ncbi:hypothetical protein J4405_00100, partial [Candidatus Woesearchaeota archaeon]|nr:hypothetical protein [Candidatus Woesearchaeota archaeon]